MSGKIIFTLIFLILLINCSVKSIGFDASDIEVLNESVGWSVNNIAALPPDVVIFDIDGSGKIEKNEAVKAVVAYFEGRVSKQEAIAVVMAYFTG